MIFDEEIEKEKWEEIKKRFDSGKPTCWVCGEWAQYEVPIITNSYKNTWCLCEKCLNKNIAENPDWRIIGNWAVDGEPKKLVNEK